jgi:predicted glycosyltransferase
VLSVGCAAVLCPYASGGETEQSTRAAALARAGRVAVVLEDRLTPEVLAAAMAQALRLPRAAPRALDGGARTAALRLEALGRKRHIKTRGNGGNDCYPCTHGETA